MSISQARLMLFFSLIAFWLWLSPLPAHADEPLPRFEPTPCPPNLPAGQIIDCGYLVVPENRLRPNGRTIRLAVAVIRSRHPNPAPDPLLFLNGGPGGQALHDSARFYNIFRLLLADLNRDVILFDQRGVGLSQPALECPELTPSLLAQATGQTLTPTAELAPYLACRDRWLAAEVDLAAYTTAASAADVNDLWRTLGYRQVNLFGVSYGTLLAETVLRDYPQGVRSVVLDSAYPLQIGMLADAAANASAYFERIFARCQADLLCRMLYPDLERVFYELLDRLERNPLTLTMNHPVSGDPFTFPFDDVALVSAALAVPPRQLPALIYDLRDGDYAAIIDQQEDKIENFIRYGPPPGRAMALSVFCSQGVFAVSPEQQAAAAGYPEAAWADYDRNHSLLPISCDQWPSPPQRDAAPAVSDIPTLILLGELDHSMSPDYARLLAADLSRSFILTVPNTGHGVMAVAGPCANNLARAFLNDPTHLPPTDCLARTGRPVFDTPFMVRAAAARHPVQVMLALLGATVVGLVGTNLVTWRQAALRPTLAWRHSLRLLGWRSAAGSALLLGLGWLLAYYGWLPLAPADVVALDLPLLVAVGAAFLFAPEDEPALELLLTMPCPPAWLVWERLAALFFWQGAVGLVASLLTTILSGQTLVGDLLRWLPLMLCLSGLALYTAIATRRAIFSLLLVSLLWIVSAVFGDSMVQRWPVTWPLHLYLAPTQPDYYLNRLFLALIGIGLIALATTRLLRDEERLLLGHSRAKKSRARPRSGGRTGEGGGVLSASRMTAPWRATLHRLGAILRYETIMQWRRSAMPALGIGFMVAPVLGAFLARNKFSGYRSALATGAWSLETVRAAITAEMVMVTWLGSLLILILMVPLVAADTIPKDRQLGVRELLDSLPFGPGLYLAGKLLSVWLSLLLCLSGAALVSAGTWRLVVGPFDPLFYGELWLAGIAPLALLNAAFSVLLAVGQPTNRRAVLVGGGVSLIFLLGLGLALVTFGTAWDFLNPARPVLLLYYLIGWPGALQGQMLGQFNQAALDLIREVVNRRRVWLSLAAAAVQLSLVWWLAGQWLRRADDD